LSHACVFKNEKNVGKIQLRLVDPIQMQAKHLRNQEVSCRWKGRVWRQRR